MAKSTVSGTASAGASVTASGSTNPTLPAPGQPYSRTKPVQKESDVMGAFRQAGKGLQVVKGLTNSRSPSKGGR
jgi:hypothetical protein